MKVRSFKKAKTSNYHLKASLGWRAQYTQHVKEIHIAREEPAREYGDEIAFFWDPTAEEDGGVVAYLTSMTNQLWIIIGENNLYAHEDSSYLFAGFKCCNKIDGLELLNTTKVRNFHAAFDCCGEYAKEFIVNGMENWDTSNVTDMSCMFYGSGANANKWEIGDISGWNVSNVKECQNMFDKTGKCWTHKNFQDDKKVIEHKCGDLAWMWN